MSAVRERHLTPAGLKRAGPYLDNASQTNKTNKKHHRTAVQLIQQYRILVIVHIRVYNRFPTPVNLKGSHFLLSHT